MKYRNSQKWVEGDITLKNATELLIIVGNVNGGKITLPATSSNNRRANAQEGLIIGVEIYDGGTLGKIFIESGEESSSINGSYDPVPFESSGDNFEIVYTGSKAWVVYDEKVNITLSSGTGISTSEDLNKTPLNTKSDGDSTGITIQFIPYPGSNVQVLVNGIDTTIGDGAKNRPCYFSSDEGLTARNIVDISKGDILYWNGSVAGYQLDSTDEIDLIYDVSSLS